MGFQSRDCRNTYLVLQIIFYLWANFDYWGALDPPFGNKIAMYFLTRNVVFFCWMKNRCTTATFIYSQTYFRTPYYNKQKCLSKFFGPLKLFDGEGRTKSILVHIKTFQTNQTLDPLKWPPAFIFLWSNLGYVSRVVFRDKKHSFFHE